MRRQWEWSLAWMDCLLVGYRRRKPQATSQKRRRASQAECLSSLPSPSIMNEKNNWLRDGMKRWDWRANETNPLFSLQQLNNSLFCGCGWKSQQKRWVCCWFVWEWGVSWASFCLGGYGRELPPMLRKEKKTSEAKQHTPSMFYLSFNCKHWNEINLLFSWSELAFISRGEKLKRLMEWKHKEILWISATALLQPNSINFILQLTPFVFRPGLHALQQFHFISLLGSAALHAHSSTLFFFGAQPKRRKGSWWELRECCIIEEK